MHKSTFSTFQMASYTHSFGGFGLTRRTILSLTPSTTRRCWSRRRRLWTRPLRCKGRNCLQRAKERVGDHAKPLSDYLLNDFGRCGLMSVRIPGLMTLINNMGTTGFGFYIQGER